MPLSLFRSSICFNIIKGLWTDFLINFIDAVIVSALNRSGNQETDRGETRITFGSFSFLVQRNDPFS